MLNARKGMDENSYVRQMTNIVQSHDKTFPDNEHDT